ncbi:hypothetical protein PANT_8d00072 [Moesziomyces antarcticus T-34]|uniref:Uncharacterized protein n=1 Tax=Pseudozyma antarctica (strain T-34) TaxID=1151754 RepID=M9LUS0_PSEA3|nr:hypothetical protein PANT_8d00072 [Moesziomyces antarcticus T-34]
MVEPGRTCACTPRSLLVPAGGVKTLDPSQRVSSKELEAKDREWRRQQEQSSQPHRSTPPTSSNGSQSTLTANGSQSHSSEKPSGRAGSLNVEPRTTKTSASSLSDWIGRKRTQPPSVNE